MIERTAQKQFDNHREILGKEYLREGDLIFFNLTGSQFERITHVGVYMDNGMFVHSTSNRAANGKNGVQISDLSDSPWNKYYVAAGRKPGIRAVQ